MARIFRLNWTHTESGQIYHYDTFCPGSNTLPPALVITMVPTFRSHPGIKRICASLHGPHKIFLFHFFTNNPFLPLMPKQNGFKMFFSHWTLVSTKYKMVNESLRILNCVIYEWSFYDKDDVVYKKYVINLSNRNSVTKKKINLSCVTQFIMMTSRSLLSHL